MTIDDKLNKILEDVATVKTVTSFHSEDLKELKVQLEPVFNHVSGMQFAFKILAGLVGVLTLLATAISIWK